MRKFCGKRLRWRLAVPLGTAFLILWLGTMILLTNATRQELQQTVLLQYQYAMSYLTQQQSFYENNLVKGLGEESLSILEENLSSGTRGLTGIDEGGLSFLIRDGAGNTACSQLTWGVGYEDGVETGQRWYLRFDEGLDDQGQLDLAQWLMEHRSSSSYASSSSYILYPSDFSHVPGDGTYARIMGIEKPGYTIAVQKIQLIHPDGTTETMVETNVQGEALTTLELPYVTICSVLLPDWNGVRGENQPVDLPKRLSNFRDAQAILEQEAMGESRSSFFKGGKLVVGIERIGDMTLAVAGQCDVQAQAIHQNSLIYGTTFLLTAAVVLILSLYLSKKVTRPIEELSRASQEGRCPEDGTIRELNTLAASFNAAQDQLAGQLERERNFTRAAAHELKTPLALLHTYAEALQEDIQPDKRQHYLSVVLDESDRMAQLVGSLLELSRLESGISLERERLELSALIQEVCAPFALPLAQKECSLGLTLEESWILGDRKRLKELVENLCSNALRHCAPGGCVQVTLAQADGQARLEVYNDGPPISEEDLPHLWEPFYRGDKSRSRELGGTGLGLAIVRAATQAHGGTWGADNMAEGVAFWVTLPTHLLPKSSPCSI